MKLKLAPILIGLFLGVFFESCAKKKTAGKSTGAAVGTSSLTSESCSAAMTSAVGDVPQTQLAMVNLNIPDSAVNMSSTAYSASVPSSVLDIDYSQLGNNGAADVSPTFIMWKACTSDGKTCTNNGTFAASHNFTIDNIAGLPLGVLQVSVKLCVNDSQFLKDKSVTCSASSPCCGKVTQFDYFNGDDSSSASPQFASALAKYKKDQEALNNAAVQYIAAAKDYINSCASSDAGTPGLQYAKNIAAYSSAELATYVDAYGEYFAAIMATASSNKLNLADTGADASTAACPVADSGADSSGGDLLSSLMGGGAPSEDTGSGDDYTSSGGGDSSSLSSSGGDTSSSGSSSSSSSSSGGDKTAVVPFPSDSSTATATGGMSTGKIVLLAVGIPMIVIGVGMLVGFGSKVAWNKTDWKQRRKMAHFFHAEDYLNKKVKATLVGSIKNPAIAEEYINAKTKLQELHLQQQKFQQDTIIKQQTELEGKGRDLEAVRKKIADWESANLSKVAEGDLLVVKENLAKLRAQIETATKDSADPAKNKDLGQLNKTKESFESQRQEVQKSLTEAQQEVEKTRGTVDLLDENNFKEAKVVSNQLKEYNSSVEKVPRLKNNEKSQKLGQELNDKLKELTGLADPVTAQKHVENASKFFEKKKNVMNLEQSIKRQDLAIETAKESYIEKQTRGIRRKIREALQQEKGESRSQRVKELQSYILDDQRLSNEVETARNSIQQNSEALTKNEANHKTQMDKLPDFDKETGKFIDPVSEKSLSVAEVNDRVKSVTDTDLKAMLEKEKIIGAPTKEPAGKKWSAAGKGALAGGIMAGVGVLATVIGATMNLAGGSCGNFMGTTASTYESTMHSLAQIVQSDLSAIDTMQQAAASAP